MKIHEETSEKAVFLLRFFTILSILHLIMIKFKCVPFCVFSMKQTVFRLCTGTICTLFCLFWVLILTSETGISSEELSWQKVSEPTSFRFSDTFSGSFPESAYQDLSSETGTTVSKDFWRLKSPEFSGVGGSSEFSGFPEYSETNVSEGFPNYFPEQEFRFVPTLTDNLGISYPRENELGQVSVSAGACTVRKEGQYTVYILEGECELIQGMDSFRSERMVLWVSPLQADDQQRLVHQVLLYLEGSVKNAFVTSKTSSKVEAGSWAGRLSTQAELQIRAAFQTSGGDPISAENLTSTENRPHTGTVEKAQPAAASASTVSDIEGLYGRAFREMFRPARLLLTQYGVGVSGNTASGTGYVEGLAPAVSSRSVLESSPELPIQKTEGELEVPNLPYHIEDNETQKLPRELSTEGRIFRGNVSSFDPNAIMPGSRKISFFSRGDGGQDFTLGQWGELNYAICKNGVTILIDGVSEELKKEAEKKDASADLRKLSKMQLGMIEISAERMVIWSRKDLKELKELRSLDLEKCQPELYLEGDIVFRQGDQKVYADQMYFDVYRRRGYIREAEVFASFPNGEGFLRLGADEIRMPKEGTMLANDAFVTTSRIGEPLYRFHMGSLLFRSQDIPRRNPFTGEVMHDPETGEPLTDPQRELIGRRAQVKVGQVPVFYLPKFALPMDSPSQIVNRFSVRSGSIFGVQAIVGFDMYRLLGMEAPWSGTNWDLDLLWYTKRGPGFGTEFKYDRTGDAQEIPLGLFAGKGKGEFDFWGIYDTGEDNLGEGRRHLEPEKKFRYQLYGRHQNTFGNDWDLKFQLGVLSDRNFQEEYFQHSWYEDSDRANQLKISKTIENRSLSLWADVRTNDFHTQTQRLPQLEFYWLGQPLFGDLLTWNSYSQVGYVHLFPDTAPEDPADRALWHLLDWETERKGVRASTRHEISYPFQLGAVKVVPFVLGEAAYWGENIYGEDTGRLYGQAGVRANLPMWQYYDFHSRLFNVNGVMHKVDFDVEALVAGSNVGVEELPLYDLPSDRALLDFAHHMSSTLFNGLPIPKKYQLRSYAVRSNLGGWVTSNTELADDLALIRFGMHHRWQTKRGMTGQERIVDWVTFDTNFNLYPNADRDNFGSTIGLLDYDLRWHPGDRLTVYSSGMFDFFSDGLCMVDVGAVLGRPEKGTLFTSLHYLTGSVENVVMRVGFNYRMSEKWAAAFMSSFDISGKGNIGESVSLTRIGESFLFTAGVNYDDPSDNFSLHFTLEPRFGKKGKVARSLDIVPPGVYGLD